MTEKLPALRRIVADLRDGRTTAGALAEQAIANYRPRLNAYIHWDPTAARERAAAADKAFAAGRDGGPLQGVPVSIKDLYGLDGTPTYAGTPRPIPASLAYEGPVVKALKTQHATIIGKTHTVEFAFGGLGRNCHWGAPVNPWDPQNHRGTGGSSAGAPVSLIEGSAVIALGTDTGGSVRIPASVTGCAGIKVTHGRWSLNGIVPLSPSLDTPGPLARTVEDAVLGFAAIDPMVEDPLGYFARLSEGSLGDFTFAIGDPFFFEDCSPGIVETAEAAIAALRKSGGGFNQFHLPGLAEADELLNIGTVAAIELDRTIRDTLPEWREHLDPTVRQRIDLAGKLDDAEYEDRKQRLDRLARQANAAMKDGGIDIVVTPTIAQTPVKLGEVEDVQIYRDRNMRTLRNTSPANVFGMCAVTIPIGFDKAGMPVGLQLMARGNDEDRLLAAALAVERSLGFEMPVPKRFVA